jgi:uncharacterized membrane protein YbhN (UPF0104 family)
MKSKTKITKTYNLVIQTGILGLTLFFIYRQVFVKTDVPGLLRTLKEDFSSHAALATLAGIIGMMGLNWGIEALKWQRMITKIEKTGYFKAFQAVLSGVAISSFTPNRVGEFIGRAYILKKASHIEGILITILGSMSQLMITVMAGSFSLLIFLPMYLPEIFRGYLYYLLIAFVLLLDILLVALFLNASFLSKLRKKMFRKGLKRVRKFFRVFGFFRRMELLDVLGLSLLRYLVFSTQYYLLLRIFRVPVSWPDAMMVISLIYLVMTVIPTIALTELGIRGSVAIYFFGLFFQVRQVAGADFNFGILSASTLLWLINLGLPALAGALFVFRLQFFRKKDLNEVG